MPKPNSRPLKPVALKPASKVGSKTTFTNKGMVQDSGPNVPTPDKEHEELVEHYVRRDRAAMKNNTPKEELVGGKADNRPDSDFDSEQLKIGTKVEFEHTGDKDKAKEIAKDHLAESPDYYRELSEMEEELEEKKERKTMNKSFERVSVIAKALRAAAAASLSRRARADASSGHPTSGDRTGEPVEVADIGVSYTRPLHEPPVVPVRRVDTPNPIPARPCGDHVYKTAQTGPQEAKPIKDR